MVDCYGISDVGLVRTNNEDVWAALPSCAFFVLADGLGGHRAGEVAARMAVEELSSSVEKICQTESSAPERIKQLLKAIEETNRAVYLLSVKNATYAGMGTTLACLLIEDGNLIHAHVGDSRIYRFRNKSLTQLTRDHSRPQESRAKNILTRAIGAQASVTTDIESVRLQDDDIYFLCSDGLTDELSLDEMRSILLNAKTIKEASDTLIASAKAKGGNDNITVVMVQVKRPHEENLSRQ